jgi:hypothetical protein
MVNIKKYKRKMTLMSFRSAQEYKETVVMLRLIYKQAKTPEDRLFIRQQSLDLLKISVVITIAALPLGSFAVAFIETGLRKINRTVFPTSFDRKSRKELLKKDSQKR